MRVFRSLSAAARSDLGPTVATLGVFDGVHLGHQEVLRRVVDDANARGARSAVVTFARHPRAVIEGKSPKLLTALRHKLRILDRFGIDAALLLRFDRTLQQMPADQFAKCVFTDALSARKVWLGYNNRFGAGATGDVELLRRLGPELGFEADQVPEVTLDGEPVSSTVIRAAILEGDLPRAARMLGRSFTIMGRVVSGDRLGRQLGFPTANLSVHHEVRPPRGVYGCRVTTRDGVHLGLSNIGIRPTVKKDAPPKIPADSWELRDRFERVEVHLLDFSGDLYGRHLEVEFLVRLRGEKRFGSLAELTDQIRRDCAAFRDWVARQSER